MIWGVLAVIAVARLLRVRLGVLVALPCLWLLLLWLVTAVKTGPQIAWFLVIGSLVGLMMYADRPWQR